jgi:hypothetical protein
MKMAAFWAHNTQIALGQTLTTLETITLAKTFLDALSAAQTVDFSLKRQPQQLTEQRIEF